MELYSLQNLFNNKIFRIPDYQRGYSWTTQQLIEFWEDLVNLPRDREHYTGMIALKKINTNDKKELYNDESWLENQGYGIYHVVDGQQRLTTCEILINEIVNFIKEKMKNEKTCLNDIELSRIVEDYLVKIKPTSEEQVKTYKFGYEIDNPSYEYFKHKILDDTNSIMLEETLYTLNLQNAKIFFKKSLRELYNEAGFEGLEEIFFKLTQKLKFNLYEIDDDFNVFVAFETMNNRGKKLSNLELLKNRLIYLITLFRCEDDVELATRKKVDDAWKTVYSYLGKNKELPLDDDDFLKAHWIIYFGYSHSKSINGKNELYDNYLLNKYFNQNRVLKYFCDEIEENQDYNMDDDEEEVFEEVAEEEKDTNVLSKKLTIGDIGKYADSLVPLIACWYDLNNPNDSKQSEEINKWLDKINRLGYNYFKPLTCVILYKKDISDEQKVRALKAIERFIFLCFRLSGIQAKYKKNDYYKLAHELYSGEKTIETIINEIEKIGIIDKNKFIEFNGVITKFERLFKDNEGYYSWNSLKYFLYEYECQKVSEYGNPKINPKKFFKKDEKDRVSIEHIYPQKPNDIYWNERFDAYSPEERKFLTGSLGNLLPLSQSINSSLQNDPFDEKKEGRERAYYNGSHSEIEVSRCEEWTPNEILQRGFNLLSFMEKRWNFRFRNDYQKYKMLFLDFMCEEGMIDDYEQQFFEEDMEKRLRSSITQEMIECVFKFFKEVAFEKMDFDSAVMAIVSESNMKQSSAYMYLVALIAMLKGNVYKRSIKEYDLKFFLDRIKEEFDSEVLENAKISVKKWIEYQHSNNRTTGTIEQLLNNY